MPLFKKKPVVIEAREWTGTLTNANDLLEWSDNIISLVGKQLTIRTLEGIMTAEVGDWIIKGVHGEFYPCKPDIFEKTYERVESSST